MKPINLRQHLAPAIIGLIAVGGAIGFVCFHFTAAPPGDSSSPESSGSDIAIAGLGCGPSALLAVGRSHDPQTAASLRALLHKDEAATSAASSLYDLADWAKRVGLEPVGLKVQAQDLSKLPFPAIVHVQPDHFLTLVEVSDERVTVVDRGVVRREILRPAFDHRFSGHVLCFRQFLEHRGQIPAGGPS